MNSPVLVALASIVPGLGFALLGQSKRALAVGGISLVLLVIGLAFAKTFFGQMAFVSLSLLWLAQIIFAFQIAYGNRQTQVGTLNPANEITPASFRRPNRKLSRSDAGVNLSRNIARQQIPANERLLKTTLARTRMSKTLQFFAGPAAFFAQSWYCIAVSSQSGLTLVQLDFLLKPIGVKRHTFMEVVNSNYRLGWQTDSLELVLKDGQKLEFEIMKVYREEAQAIASIFSKPSSPVAR